MLKDQDKRKNSTQLLLMGAGLALTCGLGLLALQESPLIEVAVEEPELYKETPSDFTALESEFTARSEPVPAPMSEVARQDATPVENTQTVLRVYAGPTSYRGVLPELCQAFENANPRIRIETQQHSDRDCVDHLQMDTADVVLICSPLSPHERSAGFTASTIAYAIVVPIVHTSTRVQSVTLSEFSGIINGRYLNWMALGGQDKRLIPSCKRRTRIEDKVLRDLRVRKPAENQAVFFDSPRQIVAYVSNQPGAMGLVPLHVAAFEKNVRVLRLNHVRPRGEAVAKGMWPLGSPLRCAIANDAIPEAVAFQEFLHTSAARRLLRRRFSLAKQR